jgi:glycosyltransferase involved in cell wall biosynthesis
MSISVLMSVYYKEKAEYLNQALESIWDKQVLKPNEIVLVEDGPLNNSLDELIEKWKIKLPDILKIVKLPENKGLSVALNEGIKYCNCDYIARMDSDDISFPDRFKKQYDYLEKKKNISVLGGSIQEIDDNFNILSTRTYPVNTEQIKKYIVKACPFAHPTVVFRRTVFNTILYSVKHRVSQDIELWYNLVKSGSEMANLSDVVLYLRRSEDFYARRSKNKAIKEFQIYWFGIIDMHGYSWKLIYPILRLIIRISPKVIIKLFYRKEFRKVLNN